MRMLRKANARKKKVLVRCDFNVPLNEKGEITNDFRIRASIPTIEWLLERNAIVILMSHLGRPKGIEESLRLTPVQEKLMEYLDTSIWKAPNCIGKEVEKAISELGPSEVMLLENLRFHPEEEKNDSMFAKNLASLGNLYINDAFGAVHRAHASIVAITQWVPSYAGLLLEKEITQLSRLLQNPPRPFVLLAGGAKVDEKLALVRILFDRVDQVILGGGLANTLLKHRGFSVGRSLVAKNKDILKGFALRSKKLVLPVDVRVSSDLQDTKARIASVGNIREDEHIVDIGPESEIRFRDILRNAGTIFWNGPFSIIENPAFRHGSEALARTIGETRALKIAGGGDLPIVLEAAGVLHTFDHISTGGGAILEFLAGKRLPGLEALGYYDRQR